MSQFRNVSDDARRVAYGLPGPRWVEPDEVVTVDDAVDESYACQPAIWRPVDAAPKKTKSTEPQEEHLS